jgi:small neutral amino acid transporter SnatA (MarC family)
LHHLTGSLRHDPMSYTFASATILLILITDPIGNIPIFANALKPVAPEELGELLLVLAKRIQRVAG